MYGNIWQKPKKLQAENVKHDSSSSLKDLCLQQSQVKLKFSFV